MSDTDDETGTPSGASVAAGPGIGGPRFGPEGGVSGGQEALRGVVPTEDGHDPVAAAEAAARAQAAGRAAAAAVEAGAPYTERDETELPLRYGEDVVVALVRDPWWVFVYWELDPARRMAARTRAGSGCRFVLRIHGAEEEDRVLSEVTVPEITCGDWYVQVDASRMAIRASMGYRSEDGSFYSVLAAAGEAPRPAAPDAVVEEAPPPSAPRTMPAPHPEIPEDETAKELMVAAADPARGRARIDAGAAGLPEEEGVDEEEQLGPFGWWRWRTESGSGLGFGFRRPPRKAGGPEVRPGPEGPGHPSSPTSGASPTSPWGGPSGRPGKEDS